MSELRGSKICDATKYIILYSNSKSETVINESDIDDGFQSIYTTIISNIQKYLSKGSVWIIGSVIDCIINISKCNPLAGSSYIKLPKELHHTKKDLINIQNTDNNECFKWCLIRYLNPAYHNAGRIRKVDKLFGDKDIKFIVKIRNTHKIERKIPSALVFLVAKRGKTPNLCVKKMLWNFIHLLTHSCMIIHYIVDN